MGKALLCCNNYIELEKLKNDCDNEYVVATYRYGFYRSVKEDKETVVFLESNETNPYEETWSILDQINSIIDDNAECKYNRLFHFSYNIEGGFPTKIARMIINLKLIHSIVQDYQITAIYIFDGKDNWVINESIFLYAQSRKLACYIYDKDNGEIKPCLKTLKMINTVSEYIENEERLLSEQNKINEIQMKRTEKKLDIKIQKQEMGVLYCSNCAFEKQRTWLLKQIDIIGGQVKVVCYYDTTDVQKFKESGLQVDCLETYFILEDFLKEYDQLKRERDIMIRKLKSELKVAYLGVDLSQFFMLKIGNYYYRELLHLLYMNVCAENYFMHNHFEYMLMWGDTNFWETWICYDNTRINNTKLFFMGINGFNYSKSKQPYPYMISAAFIPNEQAKRYLQEYQGRTFFIQDFLWGESINSVIAESYDSRKKNKIAILPAGIMEGFSTYYFYDNVIVAAIEKLLDKKFDVFLKNHPGMGNEEWEDEVRKKFSSNTNFLFYDSMEYIDHILEQCCAVITDLSSVAFDASAVGKAVFCLVDDQGYRLISQHEEGFHIYRDPDDMVKEIERTVNDRNQYNRTVRRQREYIKTLVNNGEDNGSGFIRRILKETKEC